MNDRVLKDILNKAELISNQADIKFSSKQYNEAKKKYTEAAELLNNAVPNIKDNQRLGKIFKDKCLVYISKAEEAKRLSIKGNGIINKEIQSPKNPLKLIKKESREGRLTRGFIKENSILSEVLEATSRVNNEIYPSFDTNLDLLSLSNKDLFTDPTGFLPLSLKQISNFGSWERASTFYGSRAIMIKEVSSHTIKQNIVTNCSFVASLMVCADLERRLGRRLITKLIYPQNSLGDPVLNPSGKYQVKLYINSVQRLVTIDDFLPFSRNDRLPLCTYTSHYGELWVTLLEKSYMKLYGGYDFFGSNSTVDIHALLGWIPEQVFDIKNNAATIWKRLFEGFDKGMAIATLGTGPMDDLEEETTGLCSSHAYAILDIKIFSGVKMLKIKNPWGKIRWKGKYSHLDKDNWSENLIKQTKFDLLAAQTNDDGIFWMDFDSVCQHFEAFHISWNPGLFRFTQLCHYKWVPNPDLDNDRFNFGYNPQYTLETIVTSDKPCIVWILLTKHIIDTTLPQEFQTIHIFKNIDNNRVYKHEKIEIEGVYVNNPHHLTKFIPPFGISKYSIVISQKDKIKQMYFTLRVYSNTPFKLNETPMPKFHIKVNGEWGPFTSGGNISCLDFFNNPQFKLKIPISSQKINSVLNLTLKSKESKYPLGIIIFKSGNLITELGKSEIILKSDIYRPGFESIFLGGLEPGLYTVVPTLYEPNLLGTFDLELLGDVPMELSPIPKEGAGMFRRVIEGKWEIEQGIVIPESHGAYLFVSTVSVKLSNFSRIRVRLQAKSVETEWIPIKMKIIDLENNPLCETNLYIKSPQGIALEHLFQSESEFKTSKKFIDSTKDCIIWFSGQSSTAGMFILTIYTDSVNIEACLKN